MSESKPYYKLARFRGSELPGGEEQLNQLRAQGYLFRDFVATPEGVVAIMEYAPTLTQSVDAVLAEAKTPEAADAQLELFDRLKEEQDKSKSTKKGK